MEIGGHDTLMGAVLLASGGLMIANRGRLRTR